MCQSWSHSLKTKKKYVDKFELRILLYVRKRVVKFQRITFIFSWNMTSWSNNTCSWFICRSNSDENTHRIVDIITGIRWRPTAYRSCRSQVNKSNFSFSNLYKQRCTAISPCSDITSEKGSTPCIYSINPNFLLACEPHLIQIRAGSSVLPVNLRHTVIFLFLDATQIKKATNHDT